MVELETTVEVEIASDDWVRALPDAADVARTAALAALAPDEDRAVAVLLADDATVRDLNARFRRKDTATNVLSFPAPENPFGQMGDIALAFGVCAAEARTQGKPLADHLRHLVIHGVLHLLGFDHETDADAEVMEARERRLLAALGTPDPYAVETVDER